MSEAIYNFSDVEIKKLYEYIGAELQNLSTQVVRFDEVNVLNTKKMSADMFVRMDARCRRAYARIIRKVYERTCQNIGIAPKEFDETEFSERLLKEYSPVTEYVYTREWLRKRDRMFESIVAVGAFTGVRKVLERTDHLLRSQIKWYCDLATDSAMVQAFRDGGINKVMWIAEKDERTCRECRERDGEIYDIDNVPNKHRNCRCYLKAVYEDLTGA